MMELDPHTILLCIVSHFDLPGPKYAVAKAQKDNFCDGSNAVWPARRSKSVNMGNTFSPWNRHVAEFVLGSQKINILSTLAKVMGVQTQRYTSRPTSESSSKELNLSLY